MQILRNLYGRKRSIILFVAGKAQNAPSQYFPEYKMLFYKCQYDVDFYGEFCFH